VNSTTSASRASRSKASPAATPASDLDVRAL
jgi:hypothetical protein